MVNERLCIQVQSELNQWIDFCVVVYNRKKDAERIVRSYYDAWHMSETQEPIAEYISRKLTKCGIQHDIYFADDMEAK